LHKKPVLHKKGSGCTRSLLVIVVDNISARDRYLRQRIISMTNKKHINRRRRSRRSSSLRLSQLPLRETLSPETIEAFKALKSWGSTTQQVTVPPVQFFIQQPPALQPVKENTGSRGSSFVDLLIGLGIEVYKHIWNETDPDSYKLYQATFAVAPYWPQDAGWVLNVAALGSAARGFCRVAKRVEKL